jgi:tryptophan synthase alpha chain
MSAPSETRIGELFLRTKKQGRAAFIAYLTAGDPHPHRTAELVLALERGGADLIELGLPFSDPIADGPVIQRASDRALRAGMNLPRLLASVRQIRRESHPLALVQLYESPAPLWV